MLHLLHTQLIRILVLPVYGLFSCLVAAQPVGLEHHQDDIQKITVREALHADQPHAEVEISGIVLRQTGTHQVLLHDGNEIIEIEIPFSQMPSGGFHINTRVKIKGEIIHEEFGDHAVEVNEVFWLF